MADDSMHTADFYARGLEGTGLGRVHRLPGIEPLPRPRPARYRLDVVATDIVDVIEHAGGWLFDRAVAGWEVTVLVVHGRDARPLRILGAEMLELEPVLAARGGGRLPQALAVAADLCTHDSRTRRGLLNALGHKATEVVLWGDGWPPGPAHDATPVLHTLSVAARAFKAHALTAAGTPTVTGATESFLRSGLPTGPSPGADLRPAS
ncbi:hypothetical protein [Nocardia wallacei]|uniref:hypothetical protein n=1 Tax=Nocardia TaxID=1817 RepID=UPI0024555D03|nr:hypothetical protein [Nocardia wallacei]